MTEQDLKVKATLSDWVNDFISRRRQRGQACVRADVARFLGVNESSFCQYTSVYSEKKAPMLFQVKVCLMTGHSIIELNPSLEALRVLHH